MAGFFMHAAAAVFLPLPLGGGRGGGTRVTDMCSCVPLTPARSPEGRGRNKPSAGFTLIEVLVALALVALLAVMSWRGIEAMSRSQAQLQARSAALARLQAGLAQWLLDLEQAVETPYLNAIAWDGRQLRIVRHAIDEDALLVAAWGQARDAEGLQWRRWQSGPLRDRAALLQAWNDAPAVLAQEARRGSAAVNLLRIERWDLLYLQGAGWAPAPALNAAAAGTGDPQLVEPPAGVRLRLQLPASAAVPGLLQLDWARPSQGQGRS